jgi:hypothetical protein
MPSLASDVGTMYTWPADHTVLCCASYSTSAKSNTQLEADCRLAAWVACQDWVPQRCRQSERATACCVCDVGSTVVRRDGDVAGRSARTSLSAVFVSMATTTAAFCASGAGAMRVPAGAIGAFRGIHELQPGHGRCCAGPSASTCWVWR